jgi:flavorubredoxin
MARVDHLTGGIYRISTYAPEKRISFNQFLIDDDEPALIHTGTFPMYADVRSAITQVLDPSRLRHVIVPHFEADECGGMGRFVAEASQSMLACSMVGARINLQQWDYAGAFKGMQDGDVLDLGRHRLRFWETPHVHHWDSMMVVEETTASLFPSDLFIQPNDQPSIVRENLGTDMCEWYRTVGLLIALSGLRRPGSIRCTAAACPQTRWRATRPPCGPNPSPSTAGSLAGIFPTGHSVED